MGDAALLLPVLKAVKKNYPEIKIHILCESRNYGVFTAAPFIDSIYLYHQPLSVILLLKNKYDIIMDTEQSHYLSAVFCRFLSAPIKTGFKGNGRERMFHFSIHYRQDMYEAEMFQQFFKEIFSFDKLLTLDFPYFKKLCKPALFPESIWNNADNNLVCLFPGGTVKERLWQEQKWSNLINWLTDSGWQPVLLGGRMELDRSTRILSLCNNKKVLDMTCRLSILETTWVFNRARLLISTDSGILHLGVLSNIPTISLFGAGSAAKWAPKGEKDVMINKHLECSPCTLFGTNPPCRNNVECMKKISSREVIQVCDKLLQSK